MDTSFFRVYFWDVKTENILSTMYSKLSEWYTEYWNATLEIGMSLNIAKKILKRAEFPIMLNVLRRKPMLCLEFFLAKLICDILGISEIRRICRSMKPLSYWSVSLVSISPSFQLTDPDCLPDWLLLWSTDTWEDITTVLMKIRLNISFCRELRFTRHPGCWLTLRLSVKQHVRIMTASFTFSSRIKFYLWKKSNRGILDFLL